MVRNLVPLRLRGSAEDREYRCCLCLHVRTGTMLMAFLQICVHVFFLTMIVTYHCRPDLFNSKYEKSGLMTSINLVVLGQMDSDINKDYHKPGAAVKNGQAPLDLQKGKEVQGKGPTTELEIAKKEKAKNDDLQLLGKPSLTEKHHLNHYKHDKWTRREDHYMLVVLILLSLGFSCMLLYGALRERPSYLMPYFCLQVFDFVIACLWVVSYYSYLPEVKLWILANYHLPYRSTLLKMDAAWLTFLMMALGIVWLTIKAYFIGMVWACYKYLLRKLNGDLNRSRRMNGEAEGLLLISTSPASDEDLEAFITGEALHPPPPPCPGVIPPKYEDVLKTPANANMPPPYFRGKFEG